MSGRLPLGRVLVVATEATAWRWARRLQADGIPASACPWSCVVPMPGADRAPAALARPGIELVLLTSANALAALPPRLRRAPPVVAVGPRTARVARARGLRVERVGTGTGADLARELVAAGRPRRVLWLRGRDATEDAARLLRAAHWRVEELVTYDTVARPDLAAAVRRRGPVRAWVVGSPAAASALRRALGPAAFPPRRGGPRVVVLGPTTAAALRIAGRVRPVLADLGPGGIPAAIRER